MGKTAQNVGFSRIFYNVTESVSTENSSHLQDSGLKLLFLARWLQEKKLLTITLGFDYQKIPEVWFDCFPRSAAIFWCLCRCAIYTIDSVCFGMHGSKECYHSDLTYHCNHKLLPFFFFLAYSLITTADNSTARSTCSWTDRFWHRGLRGCKETNKKTEDKTDVRWKEWLNEVVLCETGAWGRKATKMHFLLNLRTLHFHCCYVSAVCHTSSILVVYFLWSL